LAPTDAQPRLGRYQSKSAAGKFLHSPDPHMIDRGHPSTAPSFYWHSEASMNRTPAVMSSLEPDALMATADRIVRFPTPTHGCSSPPPSASNDLSASRRTFVQNAPSSLLNLEPIYPLNFLYLPNLSRSSVASAGSSYHSDGDLCLIGNGVTHSSAWHDLSGTGIHDESADEGRAEDILSRYAGLTKLDFVAIQEKLVGAAVVKSAIPDPHKGVPSLRRHSSSQSTHSLNGRESKVRNPM
jgi:serine/arginine repetitive matrix protein 2